MSQHPEELLAEYADGTLGPEDRALVEDHLSSCATCREDVAAARRARSALRALPELEAPPGITFPAIKEARRSAGPRFTWATKAVSAAAVAVLLGGAAYLAFSIVGGGDEAEEIAAEAPALEEGVEEEAAPPGETDRTAESQFAEPSALPQFRSTANDYDPESLLVLARELKGEAAAALSAGLSSTAFSFYEDFDPASLDPPVADAIRCLTDAGALDRSVVPFLVERARFEGEDAYVAAFLTGPEPDQPYDRVQLIAVDVETCSLRFFGRQKL